MVDGEGANETHLAHVGGKLMDLIKPTFGQRKRGPAIFFLSQV